MKLELTVHVEVDEKLWAKTFGFSKDVPGEVAHDVADVAEGTISTAIIRLLGPAAQSSTKVTTFLFKYGEEN